MKKLISLGMVLMLMLGVLSGCGGNDNSSNSDKEIITLKVADVFPTTHVVSKGITEWMKQVTEMTDGQVQFDHFPAEQLGKSKDMLKVVQGKVAEVSFVGPSYVSALMPLSGVMELPGALPSSVAGASTFWELTQTTLLEPDFLANGVVPVWVYTLPPYEVWTTSKAVEKPEDLKGLKLRTTGGAMDQAVKDLGGTPVTQAITEMYESMNRKVTDGSVLSSQSIEPYKVNELVKYATRGAALGTFVGTYCVNEDVWKSLPQNVQEAMLKAGRETSISTAEEMDKTDKEAFAKFADQGIKIYELTDADKEDWQARMANVEVEWLKKLGDKGELGKQLIKEMRDLTEEFK